MKTYVNYFIPGETGFTSDLIVWDGEISYITRSRQEKARVPMRVEYRTR